MSLFNMNKLQISVVIILICISGVVYAQDSTEIIRQARAFIQNKEYTKATDLLKTAIAEDGKILTYKKELFWSYYHQDRYKEAMALMSSILKSAQKDEQCYQFCGYIYRAEGKYNSCDSILKLGIKNYPSSGPLYNDLGENAVNFKKTNAIQFWEKGIEEDPDFAGNYYNAAMYYLNAEEPLWGILYGEIFVNFSPLGEKSIQIRKRLLQTYKSLFTQIKKMKTGEFETPFAKKFITHLYKQEELSRRSMSLDDLLMIRSRFMLDWFHDRSTVLPFQLFEKHRQMLQDGLFPAYHQWLFGLVEDAASYQNWKNLHAEEFAAFSKYQQNRLFHIPNGQYYRYSH